MDTFRGFGRLVGIDGAGNIPVGGDDAIDRPPRRGTGAGKIGLFGTRHASTPLDCAQALHARREDREFSTENISQTPEDVNEISGQGPVKVGGSLSRAWPAPTGCFRGHGPLLSRAWPAPTVGAGHARENSFFCRMATFSADLPNCGCLTDVRHDTGKLVA